MYVGTLVLPREASCSKTWPKQITTIKVNSSVKLVSFSSKAKWNRPRHTQRETPKENWSLHSKIHAEVGLGTLSKAWWCSTYADDGEDVDGEHVEAEHADDDDQHLGHLPPGLELVVQRTVVAAHLHRRFACNGVVNKVETNSELGATTIVRVWRDKCCSVPVTSVSSSTMFHPFMNLH